MDISETTAPRSDQQNYDDYLGGVTRTVTITAVNRGSAEQPVNVELAEFPGRPFKPNKSMRRVLVVAWGADSTAYVGRQLTLFGNPEVVFGGKAVGGVEIAAMSHLPKALTIALTATRGKRKNFTVQPITVTAVPAAAPPTVDESTVDEWVRAFNTATTVAQLQAAWEGASRDGVTRNPRVIAAKDAKKAELAEAGS